MNIGPEHKALFSQNANKETENFLTDSELKLEETITKLGYSYLNVDILTSAVSGNWLAKLVVKHFFKKNIVNDITDTMKKNREEQVKKATLAASSVLGVRATAQPTGPALDVRVEPLPQGTEQVVKVEPQPTVEEQVSEETQKAQEAQKAEEAQKAKIASIIIIKEVKL